jgi:predicted DsbA family dithiol-disulfide isomerase
VRLRRLGEDLGSALSIEWRAFPLRPAPQAGVPFKGTYREEGWRRCGRMSAEDGITFTPWPHDALPGWSLPALEAGKCVALQGGPAFERVHLQFYRAFFTESRDIADRREVERIVAEAVRGEPCSDGEPSGEMTEKDVDVDRFREDYAAGAGREAVINDYRAAAEHGVQSIPTVVIPETGRRLVGLADLFQYRAAVDEAARAAS